MKYFTTLIFLFLVTQAHSQCGLDEAPRRSFYKNLHTIDDRAYLNPELPPYIEIETNRKTQEAKELRRNFFKDIDTKLEIDIQFRLHVAEDSKTKEIDNKNTKEAITNLNEVFAVIGIKFNEVAKVEIKKTKSSIDVGILGIEMFNNTLIIDIADQILGKKKEALGGYASLPNDKTDFICVKADDFAGGSNNQNLIHEIGHYFGLTHTFGSSKHSSRISPNGDCTKIGDFICDTPFDVNIEEERQSHNINGQVEDYMKRQIEEKGYYIDSYGNRLSELPFDNFMSYYTVRSRFTSGQYAIMKSVVLRYKSHLIKNKIADESIFVRDDTKFFSTLSDISIERRDKGVIYFVTHDSIQWCNRMLEEIRNDQCLSEAFSKYTTCLYDVENFNVNEVRDRMAGGNQDGFTTLLQDSLITAFNPQLITYPQILIFRVTGSKYDPNSKQTYLEKIILGYRKPKELCKILEELSK